jgi:outer membrane protein assembly factor BamB
MGFLKKALQSLSLFLMLITLIGCAKSIIQVDVKNDSDLYPMFGKSSERKFFVPITLSDSLKLVWENDAHGNFNNSSAVVYDSLVFINDLGGRIHCFDLETGKQKGVLKTKGAIYSTPIIINHKLIYILSHSDDDPSELIFYDYVGGKELFQVEIEGRVLTQILADKDGIILCTENGLIKKISFNSNELWSIEINSRIHCNPALTGNTIIAGNDKGEIILIDSENGSVKYRKKLGSAFFSGVSIYENIAYIGDDAGKLFAIDISDGKILWTFDTGARILMNPAIDNENVYIGNLKGDLYSLQKNDGNLKWESELGGILSSTPLITNNRIVITNLFRSFSMIDKSSGKVTKNYELDGRGKLSPIFINNKIIIGYDDGTVRAYEVVY